MRHTFKFLLVSAFVLSIALASCTKEEVAADPEMISGEPALKKPDSGLYVVARFIDEGENETALFDGYTFLFDDNGTLTAFLPDQTVTGTWTMNNAETVLTITIPGTQALDNVDGTWNVITITGQRIGLRNTELDFLLFKKL